jgi:thiamine-monophosphate kinase
MKISEIGGEFALINRMQRIIPQTDDQVVVGIGDDAAVLKQKGAADRYALVTTDTLVEDVHYRTRWSTAHQIGMKAVEVNISDIAAMGGAPTSLFVSLVLAPDASVEWVEALYNGMAEACRRSKVAIAGGDTTHGAVSMISITVLGEVASDRLCLRSHAQVGDHVAVTGTLGGSAAGLNLMLNNMKPSDYLKAKHLTPRCRLEAAQRLALYVHAMIDISDGLASEINHICDQSRTGAHIHADKIPLHPDVIQAGEQLKTDPLLFALNGGEDFELLFTCAPDQLALIEKASIPNHVIGTITADTHDRSLLFNTGDIATLQGGYDHFE